MRAIIQKLKPIIRSAAAYAPPEVVDGKPPVYPYTPIKSDFEDAETVEEMMLYRSDDTMVDKFSQVAGNVPVTNNDPNRRYTVINGYPVVLNFAKEPNPGVFERVRDILLATSYTKKTS